MFGIVIFYDPNYTTQTIKEIGRTPVLDYMDALNIYAETPNPASQMVKGETEEELQLELTKLEQYVKNPYWLEMLFDSI